MAAPVLPKELQTHLDDKAREYSIRIFAQEYSAAQAIAEKLYDEMLDWQRQYDRRFHKGYPIHNVGYALVQQGNQKDALRYFILAYIEDLLSADTEDEADSTPAGQTLLAGYKLDTKLLSVLKLRVRKLKEKGRIPREPNSVLRDLEESGAGRIDLPGRIAIVPEQRPLKRFAIFQSEWEDRVFVGGSYGLDFILRDIADIVSEMGYDPVVCSDFHTPGGMDVRQKCLILLHNCKYAIFDVAEQVGQLMELERITDYGVTPLVIWPKSKEQAITEMLKSLAGFGKIKHESYTRTSDWKGIVHRFLPPRPSGKKAMDSIGPSGPWGHPELSGPIGPSGPEGPAI